MKCVQSIVFEAAKALSKKKSVQNLVNVNSKDPV